MPHIETTDLSFIADRVQPQTWTLFQVLRTRMRQMKGVTMKVQYEKHTREPIPAFFYGSRQLFHVHARGEEISATLHADQKARTKIVEDQSINWRTRDQVKKRTWAAFTLRSSKDLVPFMELVRAKYDMINQEVEKPFLQQSETRNPEDESSIPVDLEGHRIRRDSSPLHLRNREKSMRFSSRPYNTKFEHAIGHGLELRGRVIRNRAL